MLKGVSLGKEIAVSVVNKIGVLADMSKILAAAKINIEAVVGYAKDNSKEAVIKIVTSDNASAIAALKKAGYNSLTENEVVIAELENKAGALKFITEKLAGEDIDIKYVYGTACAAGCPAKILFSTGDNEKALLALKK
jgi:hypothetical protein